MHASRHRHSGPACQQLLILTLLLVAVLFYAQMSDMQRNFDEQLFSRQSEMSSRLDSMNQKHEHELSGVHTSTHYFFVIYSCVFDLLMKTV